MTEPIRRLDPTKTDASIPSREFLLEIPRRGIVAGQEWNPAGPSGRVGIVHGLGDHAGRYGRAVQALVEKGFVVEAIDLPGHGRSYGPRGHVESWDEYRAAMEAWWTRPRERGGPPVALIGHSMGALLALEWALRRPDELRGVVLSAPPFEVVLRATMLKVRLAQVIVRLWPGFSQQTTILPSMLSHDPEVVRAHNEDPLVHYVMSARLFFEFRAVTDALRKSAPRLPVPALVIHGTGDVISSPVGSERWAKSAPPGMAELRLYEGLYHEILNEPDGPRIAREAAAWIEARPSR
ncbi:MAG TPA: alpha/beta hydrolase [Candidatus Eisenbacteria bacterium]|nr:alpha/beta hydrolase [Candidatus Eisenbacteria bacterium]